MSSEAGAVTEQASDGRGLVPRLRFPEFRDGGEWVATPLRQLCTPISEKVSNAKLTPVSITAGKGFVSQASKFGRDISGEQYRNYTYLRKGDFAYNKGNSTAFPQGYVCQLTEFDEAAASSAFLCFQLSKEHQPRFIQALFDQNVHGRQLASFITSGARSNGLLNIRSDDFYGVKLPLPPEAAEQQKIAECLLSLDALISAEAEKLAALRGHKKGLMQQLFPANGETIPRLRFPEFRDSGEWEDRAVGDVFTVTRGNVLAMPLVDDVPSERKPFPVYSSQTKRNGLAGYYSECLYEDAITWTTDGANAGDVKYRDGKFYCTNVCGVLISNNGYANPCVAEIINNVSRDHVSYVGNPKLMNGVMAKIVVAMPSVGEQRKISEWLASVNEIIVASESRVDALKAHKSGMMQQLLPSSTEVIA
jgi:type I restriction enzyme S subunit